MLRLNFAVNADYFLQKLLLGLLAELIVDSFLHKLKANDYNLASMVALVIYFWLDLFLKTIGVFVGGQKYEILS